MCEYPRWVQRDRDIGSVLCCNEKEERELLKAWDTEQEVKAQAKAEAAEKLAAEAQEAAQVVVKAQGKVK